MPRGTHLLEEDRGLIRGLAEGGKNITYIAARVNRHRNTIANFLKNPETYGQNKRSGRPTDIDMRCKRQIRRLAVEDNKSCTEIKRQLQLDISSRRINQILKGNDFVKYASCDAIPRLLNRHITARLAFGEKYKFWSDEFKKGKSTICDWYSNFKRGHTSTEDSKRLGRPKEVIIPEIIRQVKEKRVGDSKSCLDMFNRNPSEFLRRYITMDETWIHHYIPESNRSSAEWREAGESRSKRVKVDGLVRFLPVYFGMDMV
ncbi:hypothetical protein ACLKA6_001150 [Drosophila palustris]